MKDIELQFIIETLKLMSLPISFAALVIAIKAITNSKTHKK